MADCTATCTITKNDQLVKVFNENVSFKDDKLTGYSDILKKLQAEVNQALTEIVDQENTNDEGTKHESRAEGDAGEDINNHQNPNDSPETPKRKHHTKSHKDASSKRSKKRKH